MMKRKNEEWAREHGQHTLLARTFRLALSLPLVTRCRRCLTTLRPSNLRCSLFLTALARVGHGTDRETDRERGRKNEGENEWNIRKERERERRSGELSSRLLCVRFYWQSVGHQSPGILPFVERPRAELFLSPMPLDKVLMHSILFVSSCRRDAT